MKKIFVTGILSLLFGTSVFAQSIYMDAVSLRKYVKNGKFDAASSEQIKSILSQYVNQEEGETFRTVFENNPYIKDFIDPTFPQSGSLPEFISPSSLTKNVGGLNVTRFAEGLAKFLVERTKQELSIAFFEDFKSTINNEKYEDLRLLFPNTAFLLQTIDKEIYKFSMYLQSLRESFITDLENLFETFPEVIQKPKYEPLFEQLGIRYLKEILLCGLHITKGLKNEVHPGVIIETLPLATFIKDPNAGNLKPLLQLIQLLSTSLSEPLEDKTQYWANVKDVYQLVQDPVSLNLYLGLLYERSKEIIFKDGTAFSKILADIKPSKDSVQKYAEFIISIADKAQTIQQYLKAAVLKQDKTPADYFGFFNAVSRFFQQLEKVNGLPLLGPQWDKKYEQFTVIANNINTLYIDIVRKNYASAVMHTVSIFDITIKRVYENINDVTVAKYPKFRGALIKYGTFVAGVSKAETSDEVQKAIESVALPVGSASIKKHAFFNVALNAYVGPFFGSQKLASDKTSKTATGIFSPVGVAFSTALGNGEKPASVSLFASIIDVGALTTFRFKNQQDTLAGDVQIKLSQIVAPGLHLVFGLPRWPVSFGFGHHWLPLLSKVERDAATLYDSKGKRWQFFLAVDIPILNFYNRSK